MFADVRKLQSLFDIDASVPEPPCFAKEGNFNPCGDP
jgi:hypothetical protein